MAFDMNSGAKSSADPYQKKAQGLDSQLAVFSRSIQSLQEDAIKLGSPADDMVFRKNLNDKISKADTVMKKLTLDIQEFQTMTLPYEKEKIREQKVTALSGDFRTWVDKFKAVVSEIQTKMKTYMEVERKRNSEVSRDDIEEGYAGKQALKQTLLDKETLKIQAETDFHAQLIEQRGQMFNQAESLMNDINSIAMQMNQNTKEQGKELVRTDQQMTVVVENAEEAQKEIVQAQSYQKSTGKWLCWLLIVVLVICAIVILVVLLK